MKKEKVLIIKTGYAEIFDGYHTLRVVSLGDVLRITPLLHLYKDCDITWVTDKKAFPLLEGNSYIRRLLDLDFLTVKQLEKERFDTLINLEKDPGICAIADNINAWKKFGFRFDSEKGEAEAYDKAYEVLALVSKSIKKENKRTSQELLFQLVGKNWNGEEYILGYRPETQEKYDIGLNTLVGPKWPTKTWPTKNWDIVEEYLKNQGLNVSRQDREDKEILTNLNKYMDWINSCKLIVSNDSLGLHLAIALKKKVLGLFGPTSHNEFYFYGRGKAILPEINYPCMPCFESECIREKSCVEEIHSETVINEIKALINSEIR